MYNTVSEQKKITVQNSCNNSPVNHSTVISEETIGTTSATGSVSYSL